jgi:hypothetical protein
MFVRGEGCGICPTILGETADRGGRRDDAVFSIVSIEGETTHAIHLLFMDVCSFSFLGRSDMPNTHKRKTTRASWTQEDLQSAGEASLEERLSLRAARW